jgi:hypothetical protein
VIKDDLGGFDSLVKELDLGKEVDRGLIIELNRKESLDIAHELRFGCRLKESLKLLKKKVSIIEFCLCEALLDQRRDS